MLLRQYPQQKALIFTDLLTGTSKLQPTHRAKAEGPFLSLHDEQKCGPIGKSPKQKHFAAFRTRTSKQFLTIPNPGHALLTGLLLQEFLDGTATSKPEFEGWGHQPAQVHQNTTVAPSLLRMFTWLPHRSLTTGLSCQTSMPSGPQRVDERNEATARGKSWAPRKSLKCLNETVFSAEKKSNILGLTTCLRFFMGFFAVGCYSLQLKKEVKTSLVKFRDVKVRWSRGRCWESSGLINKTLYKNSQATQPWTMNDDLWYTTNTG